jgi:hypothetical protein
VIIKPAAWHAPPSGDSSSAGVLGGKQASVRDNHRIRRKALPDSRIYAVAEHQPAVASLPACPRTWLVDYRTYQQAEDQLARAGPGGVDGTNDEVARIKGEHVWIGAVIENYLERVGTVLCDTDDQHVVIIAQIVTLSGAAVDVALDSRADFGHQVLRLAVHQDRQSQDIAADHQPQNLGGDQTCPPVHFFR